MLLDDLFTAGEEVYNSGNSDTGKITSFIVSLRVDSVVAMVAQRVAEYIQSCSLV